MKVNVMGRGMVPYIGTLAPIRNVDLSEKEIRGLLNFKAFRVYDAETRMLITKENVTSILENAIKRSASVVVENIPVIQKKEVTPDPVVEEPKEIIPEPVVYDEVPDEAFEPHTIETTEEEVVVSDDEGIGEIITNEEESNENGSSYNGKKRNKKRH